MNKTLLIGLFSAEPISSVPFQFADYVICSDPQAAVVIVKSRDDKPLSGIFSGVADGSIAVVHQIEGEDESSLLARLEAAKLGAGKEEPAAAADLDGLEELLGSLKDSLETSSSFEDFLERAKSAGIYVQSLDAAKCPGCPRCQPEKKPRPLPLRGLVVRTPEGIASVDLSQFDVVSSAGSRLLFSGTNVTPIRIPCASPDDAFDAVVRFNAYNNND